MSTCVIDGNCLLSKLYDVFFGGGAFGLFFIMMTKIALNFDSHDIDLIFNRTFHVINTICGKLLLKFPRI